MAKKKQKQKPKPKPKPTPTPPATRGVDFTILGEKYEESLLRPADEYEYDDPENPRVEPNVEADNNGKHFLAGRLAEERRGLRAAVLRAHRPGSKPRALWKPWVRAHRTATFTPLWHTIEILATRWMTWEKGRRTAPAPRDCLPFVFYAEHARSHVCANLACSPGRHVHWQDDAAGVRRHTLAFKTAKNYFATRS
jgi:hypothetical protein